MELVKMRSCWIRVGPESNDWVLLRPREDTERHTGRRRRRSAKTEAEVGAMRPHAKEGYGLPQPLEVRREAWNRFSPRIFRKELILLTP